MLKPRKIQLMVAIYDVCVGLIPSYDFHPTSEQIKQIHKCQDESWAGAFKSGLGKPRAPPAYIQHIKPASPIVYRCENAIGRNIHDEARCVQREGEREEEGRKIPDKESRPRILWGKERC